MTALFDDATAVTAAGEGRWDVTVRREFEIVNGHPNGGYLLALLGRAALAAVGADGAAGGLAVVGATATYVSAPVMGAGVVETTVLRTGRTASQVRAALVQEGRVTVDVVMTIGRLADEPAAWGAVPPVEMPSLDDCRARGGARRSLLPGVDEPPLARVLRTDFDPGVLSFLSGTPSGEGELRAWLSLVDRDWDPLALLFAVDALPPATFEVAITGWVPTLSLTAYIRAVPAPGPLSVRFRAQVIAGGFVDEVADIWDSTGRLVAQSTQLAAIRMPPPA